MIVKSDKWTAADEFSLQSTLRRKEEILKRNRRPVLALCEAADSGLRALAGDVGSSLPEQLADWMISNADQIRDALEPYDSGTRPASDGHS